MSAGQGSSTDPIYNDESFDEDRFAETMDKDLQEQLKKLTMLQKNYIELPDELQKEIFKFVYKNERKKRLDNLEQLRAENQGILDTKNLYAGTIDQIYDDFIQDRISIQQMEKSATFMQNQAQKLEAENRRIIEEFNKEQKRLLVLNGILSHSYWNRRH